MFVFDADTKGPVVLNWNPVHLKTWVVNMTGLSNDLLHVYCGLSLQLSICMVLGLTLRSATPLYFVYAFELFNEIIDIIGAYSAIDSQFVDATIRDFCNTVAIPTLLLLIARGTRLFND